MVNIRLLLGSCVNGSESYERHLFELSADDGDRVQSQPLVHQSGVESSEIVAGRQVSLGEVFGLQRWVGPVHATIDPVSDGERHPGRPMVRAGAVVTDPASELAEHHHHHILSGIVFPQVGKETVHRFRHVYPELGVGARLVEVGVERPVGGVEDLGAQSGQVHLSNVLQGRRDGGVAVLDRR